MKTLISLIRYTQMKKPVSFVRYIMKILISFVSYVLKR